MKYGAEGYALYWLCIELIVAPIDKTNITFELEHDAEILAYRLKIDSTLVEEIMKFMIGLNLFEISPTTSNITCLKLANRLENSIVKSSELKKIQQLISESEIRDNPGQSGIIRDNPGKVRTDKDKKRLDLKTLTSFEEKISNDDISSKCPHKEIIDLYHEILPELPAVKKWTPQRQKFLRCRWSEDEKRQNLLWWKKFFKYVSTCDFLMGKINAFQANLEWLVKPSHFIKVIEGNYDNKNERRITN